MTEGVDVITGPEPAPVFAKGKCRRRCYVAIAQVSAESLDRTKALAAGCQLSAQTASLGEPRWGCVVTRMQVLARVEADRVCGANPPRRGGVRRGRCHSVITILPWTWPPACNVEASRICSKARRPPGLGLTILEFWKTGSEDELRRTALVYDPS
jgi:hypothetical protein